MKNIVALFALLLVAQSSAYADLQSTVALFTQEEVLEVGEKIYQTPGQQTCLKCHRGAGEGEGWAGAADLRKPYTWNTFKTLGGYEALEANPEQFRTDMISVLKYLISVGGIKMNLNFKKDHPELSAKMDWSKTEGKRQYDMMMWGVAQPEMVKKVKQVQAELKAAGKEISKEDMTLFAVYSVFEYVRNFEEPNKDNPELPMIIKTT